MLLNNVSIERSFCYKCTRHMPLAGGATTRDARGRTRWTCSECKAKARAHALRAAPANTPAQPEPMAA